MVRQGYSLVQPEDVLLGVFREIAGYFEPYPDDKER
jgi:hypothetical protein